ncbi:zinc finger and SCAN domain containing protein [Reticulomyxa filosa]|uniref:Zinc finger and SCAN domain containing protein n=1 Tax=Reticulomyxa filosa TaxID=46433 RepID=X6NIY6_RETFI|nr:zinc finger and SCAN domain containing protein [Reticulomyxa filosa]|eukprot:ETO25858.1 zinc finger and SCAN domain containing protein [Reticulomyxa filosa]
MKEVFLHKKKCKNNPNRDKKKPKKKEQVSHKRTATPKKYECEKCGKTFKNNNNLKQHITGVHTKVFRCPYDACQLPCKLFGQQRHLRVHIERFHLKVRETCEFCKKSFYDKSSLRKHINDIHLGVKQFTCFTCHKCFARFGLYVLFYL